MKRFPLFIVIAACALFAAVPTAALAANPPVLDQYGNPVADDAPIGAEATGDSAATPDTLGNAAGATDDQTVTEVAAANAEPVQAAAAAAPAANGVGSLPFTGAELTSVVLAAILLLGSGFALRRVGFAGSRRARDARS